MWCHKVTELKAGLLSRCFIGREELLLCRTLTFFKRSRSFTYTQELVLHTEGKEKRKKHNRYCSIACLLFLTLQSQVFLKAFFFLIFALMWVFILLFSYCEIFFVSFYFTDFSDFIWFHVLKIYSAKIGIISAYIIYLQKLLCIVSGQSGGFWIRKSANRWTKVMSAIVVKVTRLTP